MGASTDPRFEVLDGLRPPDLRAEIRRRVAGPVPRPSPSAPPPWRRILSAAVALLLFAAASVLVWEAFRGEARRRPSVTPAEDPWSWAPEGWTELPLPPEIRDGASIVWTGRELVVWGGWPRGTEGEHAEVDGFAFDAETRSWRTLPPAPLGDDGPGATRAEPTVTRDERGGANAVWTGSEILFWDIPLDDGSLATLALDPEKGAWRRLGDPIHRPTGAWAWTGTELVVVGGGDRDEPTTVQGAALDPATGAWRPIAEAPMGLNLANAVWTGREVVVVGSELNRRNWAETPTAIALGYDPATDAWRRLPDPPLSPQASEAVWFGDRLVAWDHGADSAQYLPAEDRWQGLGRLPLGHGECYVHGVAIETAVFAWNCGIPDAWYPDLGWVDVPGGPQDVQLAIDERISASLGRAVAAGSVVVVEQVDNLRVEHNLYIGSAEAPMHLWIWRPPSAPELPPPPTREDAEYLVAEFLLAWQVSEAYLPPMATQDVLDRCRAGVDGCPMLGGGRYQMTSRARAVEIRPAVFEVSVVLGSETDPDLPVRFVVGPGTAADGGTSDLIVLDVLPS